MLGRLQQPLLCAQAGLGPISLRRLSLQLGRLPGDEQLGHFQTVCCTRVDI